MEEVKVMIRDMKLDHSQFAAVKHVLDNELALIQGPPGTGKTYIGVQIVKFLLKY
jgi:superfamily II DNA or RNA helicase